MNADDSPESGRTAFEEHAVKQPSLGRYCRILDPLQQHVDRGLSHPADWLPDGTQAVAFPTCRVGSVEPHDGQIAWYIKTMPLTRSIHNPYRHQVIHAYHRVVSLPLGEQVLERLCPARIAIVTANDRHILDARLPKPHQGRTSPFLADIAIRRASNHGELLVTRTQKPADEIPLTRCGIA